MLTDLTVTPFPETLRCVSSERRSGDLQVRARRVVKTVFFDHGRLVFAASNLKGDRLGETLVALGRITDGDLRKASAIMRQRDRARRFGDALVQAGLMDKNEVGHSVARQVRRIVLSIFSLDEGAVSFEERPCPIPLEYMVSLSVHRLLYLGIKTMRDGRLMLTGLGDRERRVNLAAVSPFPFSIQKCSSEELDILDRCRGKVRLGDLLMVSGRLSGERVRASYALCASGILEDAEDTASGSCTQPVVQMETGSFLLSPLQRRPEPPEREVIRQEIAQELAQSVELNREKWLHVSQAAPREVLVGAIEAKMDRYHALLEKVGDDPGMKTDIELILGRASALLRLARHTPATTPESSWKTVPVLADRPAAPSPQPRPPDGATVAPHAAEVDRLRRKARAEMAVADYAGAVVTYTQLVELEPAVAAHHVKRAIAMACWPQTSRQAEIEFHEALSLDPNNPDTHYQFGLYYKAMRQRTRAVQEMRTAVSLSPRHERARRELEALSPADPALTHLSTLLR